MVPDSPPPAPPPPGLESVHPWTRVLHRRFGVRHTKCFGGNLFVPPVLPEDFSLWGMWLHWGFF